MQRLLHTPLPFKQDLCREYLTILRVLFRFRQILKKIIHTKQEMGKTMRAGAFALTEAKYAAGEFGTTVLDSVEAVGAHPFPPVLSLYWGSLRCVAKHCHLRKFTLLASLVFPSSCPEQQGIVVSRFAHYICEPRLTGPDNGWQSVLAAHVLVLR